MISFAIVVPIVAASSLTAAFLVPLRDARRGERATLRGFEPLRPLFSAALEPTAPACADSHTERAPGVRLRAMASQALARLYAMLGIVHEPNEIDGAAFERELALSGPPDDEAGVATAVAEIQVADADAQPVSDESAQPPVTIRAPLARRDAVPPLTRARLRPGRSCISWPTHLRIAHLGLNESERHDLLARLARDDDGENADALRIAYAEEDAAGRLLALKALARSRSESARRFFTETVVRGSDDERAFSVDVLAGYGEHEALHAALSDRIDAIAARAALAIVGTSERSDYVKLLLPSIDAARLDRLLTLLSAVLE